MKKYSIVFILFFICGILAYSQQAYDPKFISFSIGAGTDARLNTFKYETSDYSNDFTNGEFNILAFFEIDFFSFFLFNTSLNFIDRSRLSGNDWVGANLLDLKLTLLWKYPFSINQNMIIFPLYGFGYDMTLSGNTKDSSYEWKREDLKDSDTLIAKFGGGLDYTVSENTKFSLKIFYNVFLFSKQYADIDYINYSQQGPNIILGISYIFK